MTDYEREAKEFLFDCQAKMRIVYDGKERNSDWGDTVPRNKYIFTITTPFGTMKGDFWDRPDKTQKRYRPTEKDRPTKYDILACLEKYDVGTIDDFVSEFGYEVHSWAEVKRIKKIYDRVTQQYNDLCRIFTPEQMERLREIQ